MSCKRDTMADIMVHSADNSPRREVYRCGMLSPVLGPRSSFRMNSELKHSRSDDLILQGAPYTPPDMQHGISDAAFQIQKDACVVYDDEVNDHRISVACYESPIVAPESDSTPLLKLTGDFSSEGANKRCSVIDRIDPEDSIGDIISQNDFYRFVLFKRHYEKYLDISRKYEEARSLAYYLEEKYHEIKVSFSLRVYGHCSGNCLEYRTNIIINRSIYSYILFYSLFVAISTFTIPAVFGLSYNTHNNLKPHQEAKDDDYIRLN